MAKTTNYIEEDDDFFTDDDESGSSDDNEKVKESKRPQDSRAARQRLDSRSEELWLKQQLSDWDDPFDDETRA